PGQAFSATAVHTTHGRALRRDGSTLLVASGGVVRSHQAGAANSVAGEVRWSANRTITLALPLAPPPSDQVLEAKLERASAAGAAKSVKARWRRLLAPVIARVRIPERKSRDALLAGVVTLLQSRLPAADGSGAWAQHVNALQYRAFWLRDAALITGALGRVGLDST